MSPVLLGDFISLTHILDCVYRSNVYVPDFMRKIAVDCLNAGMVEPSFLAREDPKHVVKFFRAILAIPNA